MTTRTPTANEQALLDYIAQQQPTVTLLMQAIEGERTGDSLQTMLDTHDELAQLVNDFRADVGDTSGSRTEGGTKSGGGDPPNG